MANHLSGRSERQREHAFNYSHAPKRDPDLTRPAVGAGIPDRSWWIAPTREEFMAKQREEVGRMKLASFGQPERGQRE
jgi:hypothetical protein